MNKGNYYDQDLLSQKAMEDTQWCRTINSPLEKKIFLLHYQWLLESEAENLGFKLNK